MIWPCPNNRTHDIAKLCVNLVIIVQKQYIYS